MCEKRENRMREKQKVKESTDRLEKGVSPKYDGDLSIMVQAEQLIDQLEAEKTIFTSNERNLIMNYAYKLDDMDKTRELAEKLAYREQYAQQDVRHAVLNAQAEIDALPDPMIGLSEMRTYGYTWNEMLPLTNEKALEMFEQDFPVYLLYSDGAETIVEDRKQILEHNGICGIEKDDWAKEKIQEEDVLMPIDYDEFMEKVEETNRIVQENVQSGVVAELSADEQEAAKQEENDIEVTWTVSECGEFHILGELYENIPTVEEAVAIWKQIPPERMCAIPTISIHVHRVGEESYMDDEVDLFSGKRIDLEILDYVPSIKNEPKAMDAIAELIAKFPGVEIEGVMSEEMEAMVWEKRMPNLTPAEQLAVGIDRLAYDYDTILYRDSTRNMTKNVSELVGKRAKREDQKQPVTKTSLKARLSERKTQIAGGTQNVQKDMKNKHREM